MRAFEISVLILLAPVGAIAWGLLYSILSDTYDEWRRKGILRRSWLVKR